MDQEHKMEKAQPPQIFRLISTGLICIIILTSCGYPVIQTVEVTRVVPQTVVVIELVVIIETATPKAPLSPEKTITTPALWHS